MNPDLVLVHGIFVGAGGNLRALTGGVRERRIRAFAECGAALGVSGYEWVDGHCNGLANRALRRARGTARAVDAVEIIELEQATLRQALAEPSLRTRWHSVAGCAADGLDPERSFILMGMPRLLVDGVARGLRVLWFGNGLSHLSEREFLAHYTGHHGPLVAGYAQSLGLRRYRQVPDDETGLCDSLRGLGLGRASPPAVFAELVMVRPSFRPRALRARRAATREIAADEKRHIDFGRSMLLLA